MSDTIRRTRVLVIGGGVVGVATLYQLTRIGWTDVTLLERKELTSGSTWHAAGLLPLFNMSYSVGKLHKHSVELYSELEDGGEPVGLRRVGNLRLAMTRDRMDEFLQYVGVAASVGVEVEVLTPDQARERWPLMTTEGLVGAIRHPHDGYVQPADLTQRLAALARKAGATIRRNVAALSIAPTREGEWRVETSDGAVVAEHLVLATGNFARRTGRMLGLDLPVIPVEHQYIVTEPHPEIVARHKAGLPEMGVLREADGSWYMREENGGLLLGPYERGAPNCYVDGPRDDSEYELFPGDLERLEPHIESAMARVPAFGEAGVKTVYNGAIAYTPDGSPLVGPAWDLRNVWLNEGHSFGVTAAGGAGWQLAHWIANGEPSVDMLGVDPRRFDAYATGGYLKAKTREAYENVFTVHYPDEERPAGRPLRAAPVHDRMAALGAVFGQKAGWERPNFFAEGDEPREDHWSFRRSRWFEAAGREARNVAENVGLLDMTAFAKARVSGPGAAAALDRLVANRLPGLGRVALAHALTPSGGVLSEFTLYREAEDSFYLVSAGAWRRLDHDVLRRALPDEGVRYDDLTNRMGVLVVAGPKARTLMQRVSEDDWSFPWLSGREVEVGMAPARALRVNFVGELGWELHHPIEHQTHIFDALTAAGADLGLRPFGVRAMESMRIEKSYRMVGAELSVEYSALESGLDRFVKLDKGGFTGREALLRAAERGPRQRFVTLRAEDVGDADPLGNNPLTAGGRPVGRTTSGAFGFRVGESLALAMVAPEAAEPGTTMEMSVLGRPVRAVVVGESPWDPENARLRA